MKKIRGEDMQWKELSNDAKSVIEWVEDPFTDKRTTIEVKIGERFQRNCPMYCGDFSGKEQNVNVLITKELYQEILRFVTEDKELQCEQFTDSLILKIKDDSDLVLH